MQQRSIRENIALPSFRNAAQMGADTRARASASGRRGGRRLQIDTRAESELRRLSGGNQQKVVIARWLANGFKRLLCFDATRGIDVGTKHQIYRAGARARRGGSAVLLFTSELTEIRLACDRAIVLFGGRVVDEMPAERGRRRSLAARRARARRAPGRASARERSHAR